MIKKKSLYKNLVIKHYLLDFMFIEAKSCKSFEGRIKEFSCVDEGNIKRADKS